ncbi:5-hydroxytryptamine receptor 3A-like [Scleropages formosus]|uniref:5-hydroxytryptamine receptor 3A-like n=1 Tax=Scleropages formosus TaxID=113540 RepID=A0A0P7WT70_SCLFO|nr:5-hydroxytryptamine receptor 3A-like [Scleropages formosus]
MHSTEYGVLEFPNMPERKDKAERSKEPIDSVEYATITFSLVNTSGTMLGQNWVNLLEQFKMKYFAKWPYLIHRIGTVQCSQSSVMINCSQPNAKSLYDALENIFDLNAIRPVVSLKTATNVTVSITLYGILGVDEKAQLLTTYLWLELFFGFSCSMDEDRSPKIPYVYVNSSGYVSDSRPVRVVSSCNLDIYTFPFDIQNCSLTFNSYTHVASDIRMYLEMSGEETLQESNLVMRTVGEWELLDIKAEGSPNLTDLDFEYDYVVYYIVMRRRPTVYVVNLLIPSCFLITVDLLSSLLPVENVDRSSFKMTLILGYTVFLLIMNDLLPITGNRIPLINVFFSSCLALMVASVLETVFITSILFNSSRFSKVPQWVRRFVLHYLAYLVCFSQKPKDKDKDSGPLHSSSQVPDLTTVANEEVTDQAKILDSCEKKGFQREDCAVEELKKLGRDLIAIRAQVEEHLAGNEVAEEWSQIGNVIDRLLFGLYLLFLIFSFIIIAAVWVHWHSH